MPNKSVYSPEAWSEHRPHNFGTQKVLSIGIDELPIWPSASPDVNRTSVTMYLEFMTAFADALRPFLGSTVVEVQVGLGPAGELRYPSYPSGR